MKKENWLEKLADFIVDHERKIAKVFLVLVVFAFLARFFVGVNYDLTKYLPADSPSKKGIELMKKEFGYPGTARLLIKDVSLYEAEAYKNQLTKIDGIDQINWLDTTQSVYTAEDFLQTQTNLDDYYKDNKAVMDIVFEKGDSSPKTAAAITQIRQLLGEKAAMTGPAVNDKTLNENVAQEMPKIMFFAVIVILLILTLTTNSWFEPILFMITMGVAIILNLGSNLIFGEISFLSSSVAAVLQLAVAMDYSIFLLHSFTRERRKGKTVDQAIKKSLVISIPSILASALTTIIGFLALVLMKFQIGADMGLVLAKSIIWSLLVVVFLMPALIIRWNKLIEKSQHHPFVPALEKFARFNFKSRYILAGIIIILFIPAYVAQGMNHFMYGTASMSSSKGSRSLVEKQEIETTFGKNNLLLIVVPNRDSVIEEELSNELSDLSYVKKVTALAKTLPNSVPAEFLPHNLTSQLRTKKYTRILLILKIDGESDETFAAVDEIKTITKKYYGDQDVYFVGETPATQDIKTTITQDYNTVNFLSILGVGIVILLTFSSVLMAVVVIIPIEIAIIFNAALPFLYGESLSFLGFLMVSSMQLGATVDYSILLTNNYLDKRKQGFNKKEAVIKAIEKSALSIVTSGTVLTSVGYAIFFVSSVATIGDLGRLIGRGAFISMIMVLCFLPFLLVLSDELIMKEQTIWQSLGEKFKEIAIKRKLKLCKNK